MHCDGPGWFGISRSVPSAEASNDPRRPWQRSWRKGISETFGPAVHGWRDGFEYFDVFGLEGGRRRPLVRAVTGMNQLHAHGGGAQRNDGELAQRRGRLDLA